MTTHTLFAFLLSDLEPKSGEHQFYEQRLHTAEQRLLLDSIDALSQMVTRRVF
jgi:hypothetical protein